MADISIKVYSSTAAPGYPQNRDILKKENLHLLKKHGKLHQFEWYKQPLQNWSDQVKIRLATAKWEPDVNVREFGYVCSEQEEAHVSLRKSKHLRCTVIKIRAKGSPEDMAVSTVWVSHKYPYRIVEEDQRGMIEKKVFEMIQRICFEVSGHIWIDDWGLIKYSNESVRRRTPSSGASMA